jgi:hypothetical protein
MLFTNSGFIVECEERDRLIALLDKAMTAYSRLDAQLVGSTEKIQGTAYVIARAAVEVAREQADEAQQALIKHRQDHGC